MTLSDHQGKQIIRDFIQKCFLWDFRTMFISPTQTPVVVTDPGKQDTDGPHAQNRLCVVVWIEMWPRQKKKVRYLLTLGIHLHCSSHNEIHVRYYDIWATCLSHRETLKVLPQHLQATELYNNGNTCNKSALFFAQWDTCTHTLCEKQRFTKCPRHGQTLKVLSRNLQHFKEDRAV
jgi:hypothetical protein